MADRALALATALAAVDAALSAADAPDKTPEQILAEMAAASRNAAENGTVPGTRAAIDRMKRKWCRFVVEFGARLGYVSGASPTIQFVLQFVSYMHNNRDRWSSFGRKGMGNSAFLSAAYHLPKYVFPELEYAGWDGLDSVALKMKGVPHKAAVLDERKRLVVGNGDVGSTGQVYQGSKRTHGRGRGRQDINNSARVRIRIKTIAPASVCPASASVCVRIRMRPNPYPKAGVRIRMRPNPYAPESVCARIRKKPV
jgi:hypothetical protein